MTSSSAFEKFLCWESSTKDTIDFKKIYVDMADADPIAGLVLSQLLFWHLPARNGKSKLRVQREGYYWVAKGREDWWEECRLKPKRVDRALAVLRDCQLIETRLFKFNGSPTIHVRIRQEEFLRAWQDNLPPLPPDEGQAAHDAPHDWRPVQKPAALPASAQAQSVSPQTGKTNSPSASAGHVASSSTCPSGEMDLTQRSKSISPEEPDASNPMGQMHLPHAARSLDTESTQRLRQQPQHRGVASKKAARESSAAATPVVDVVEEFNSSTACPDHTTQAPTAELMPVGDEDLAQRLAAAGLGRSQVQEVLHAHPREAIEAQLEELPHRALQNAHARGSWLYRSITQGWACPHLAAKREAKEKQAQAAREQAHIRERAQSSRKQREQEEAQVAAENAALQALPESVRRELEAAARHRLGVLGAPGRSTEGLAVMCRALYRERFGPVSLDGSLRATPPVASLGELGAATGPSCDEVMETPTVPDPEMPQPMRMPSLVAQVLAAGSPRAAAEAELRAVTALIQKITSDVIALEELDDQQGDWEDEAWERIRDTVRRRLAHAA